MSSTTTVSVAHVLRHLRGTDQQSNDKRAGNTVPFRILLQDAASFAAVDNSGSTWGGRLDGAKQFVDGLGVSLVSLWNSHCEPPLRRNAIVWRSDGGTSPVTVFSPVCHVPDNASAFVFATDGECRPESLAQHAHVTAHLPSLLVIFDIFDIFNNRDLVADFNVSVLMAHFMAARTAAVLITNGIHNRVVAVKGTWVEVLRAPAITEELQLSECPLVTMETLRALPSVVTEKTRPGTLLLEDDRSLDLSQLLRLEDGRELLSQLSEVELENVARAQFALGRLSEWRSLLSRWLTLLSAEGVAHVEAATTAATGTAYVILGRLRNATDDAERARLTAELQTAMQVGAVASRQATDATTRELRQPRAMINAALAFVSALETSGMSAASLGRLSNRAGRAKTILRTEVIPLAELATDGAPHEVDLISLEEGPVALCLSVMTNTEDNTSDFALDQGLVVGQRDVNAVFEPTLVSLSIADRIEECDKSPLTRQSLSVCLPIVKLADNRNRKAVYQRLCLVFMNELAMPHVWLIALGSILRTLETRAWADPRDTPVGRLLSWFAGQILEHVVISAGNRLSPTAALTVGQALTAMYQTDILTVHSSINEASTILRILHRFPAPAAISDAALRRSMLARIATGIAQSHRNWLQANHAAQWNDQGPTSLAALTTAVNDTRVTESGAHVPIAGTGRTVERLDPLLTPSDIIAVVAFVNELGVSLDDLMTPGLTLVVLGTLDRLTNPHVSSSQAVEVVRAAPMVAAEMSAATAGTATLEDARDALHKRLAWAWVPVTPMSPFTTPYGPSVLWFYAPNGAVINMTHGFVTSADEQAEAPKEMVERLTEHVRKVRGLLMQRYFATTATGSLIAGTILVPLQRAMVDEHAFGPQAANELADVEQRARFIHRAVQRVVGRRGDSIGNVHSESLEREAVVLLPSLVDTVNAFLPTVDARASPASGITPLSRRVALELGTRSPDCLGTALPPVWVPHDDPDVVVALDRVLRERTTARIVAMRRRRQPTEGVVASSTVPSATSSAPPNLLHASRTMTWYLRHRAATRPDGFVPVDDVISAIAKVGKDTTRLLTVDEVLAIAEADRKGRFDVREEEGGQILVRANQGHSVTTVDPEQLMTPIESPEDLPVCLHGTYHAALANIFRTGALDRMGRQAIQMAVGLRDDPAVRSGIRRNVEVVIYVDVDRAMSRHGLRFFRSTNGVVCSAGPIPIDCFLRVVKMSDGGLVECPSRLA